MKTTLVLLIVLLLQQSLCKVEVDVCMLSKCGDAREFLDKIVFPLVEKISPIMDIRFHFMMQSYQPSKYGFISMHGEEEVEGNLLELCVQHLDKPKMVPFLQCMNREFDKVPQSAGACLNSVGIEPKPVFQCMKGELGRTIGTSSLQKCMSLRAVWSPTLYINTDEFCPWNTYKCNRRNNLESFMSKICQSSTENEKPLPCSSS